MSKNPYCPECFQELPAQDGSPESPALDWTPWTKANDMPREEWLIVETDGPYPWQTAIFRNAVDGNALGVVGGRFHFDHEIKRWARLSSLLPGEEES